MTPQITNTYFIKTDRGTFSITESWQVHSIAGGHVMINAYDLNSEREAIEWIASQGEPMVNYYAVKCYQK